MSQLEPQLIEIDGAKYKVGGFSLKVQNAFLEFMRFHELDAIKRSRADIGDEDYFILLRQHLAHAGYDIKFGSPHFFKVLGNPDNLAELLWYALTEHQKCPRNVVSDWIDKDTGEAIAVFKGLFDARERDVL